MPEFLMVPTHVDALYLATERMVARPMADFSRLPYFDGQRDVNGDNPYLSKLLLSPPFNADNLLLGAGVHLHWSLPDSLTRGHASDDRLVFPAAPNRWLVARQAPGKENGTWIVDSDYLFPAGVESANSSPYPIPVTPDSHEPPFRYMGRTLSRAHWEGREAGGEQFLSQIDDAEGRPQHLTALGYGEPAFAAFYPNCLGIFGFHDADPPANLKDVRYSVFGWYREATADICAGVKTAAELVESLNWRAQNGQEPLAAGAAAPQRSIYYAQVTFQADRPAPYPPADTPVHVGLGNTPTEALSALLARDPRFDHEAAPANAAANGAHAREVLLEEGLEALHLADSLRARRLDVGPRFQEARHEKGFQAREGGAIWRIRPAAGNQKAKEAPDHSPISLPHSLVVLLNVLNLKQLAYDQARAQIISRREQLYAAWYQYMVAAYPSDHRDLDVLDVDETKAYIKSQLMEPLQKQIEATGRLALTQAGDDGPVTGAVDASGEQGSLASEIASLVRLILDALKKEAWPYSLGRHAAPRFWQPNEPVILLQSPLVEPSDRHGDDSEVACPVLTLDDVDLPGRADELLAWLNGRPATAPGKRESAREPWHPFLLEWNVELAPTTGGSNLEPDRHEYAPGFITGNYALDQNAVDLSYRAGRDRQRRAHCNYTGRSLLTPQSKFQLAARINDYLEERLLADYQAARDDESASQPGFFQDQANRGKVIAWYKDQPAVYQDAFTTWTIALRDLIGEDFHVQAQALSGFNDALFAQQLALQLPLAEPLGFREYQEFSREVGELVGVNNTVSPNPVDDFNPIRSGMLTLNKLRLVDTFGRSIEINPAAVYGATTLSSDERADRILLPPRFTQAARLNFRWLRADLDAGDEMEMNEHPSSYAVCGWLVANNLDGSLQVFDADGAGLGLLDETCTWQPAPGSPAPPDAVEEIHNPHLRRVLGFIAGRGQAFLNAFITTLDSAQENISPEAFGQHLDLALLMGRPLAVVRASLQLEQQGLPAVNPDVILFRHQVQNDLPGETAGVGKVRVRARLGEHRQLNDGLVGYWLEGETAAAETTADETAELPAPFFTPQAEAIDGVASDLIRTYHDPPPGEETARAADAGAMNIELWFDRPALILTMLVDPIGDVHATTGVLPAKSIHIPPDQIAAALRNMTVTFFSTPILTRRGDRQVDLPLRAEPGFKWRWLQRGPDKSWRDDFSLKRPRREPDFAPAPTLREGWLTLQPAPMPKKDE